MIYHVTVFTYTCKITPYKIFNQGVNKNLLRVMRLKIDNKYCISTNKRCPLISAAPLGIHIEISASFLISAAPLNATLIRIQ